MAFTGLIIGEIIALKVLEKVLEKKAVAESLAKASKHQFVKGKNDKKTWTIKNLDDLLAIPITGQYGAESYEETIGSNYVEFNALGRSKPITQFVNGNSNPTSFTAVLFAKDLLQQNTTVKLAVQNLKAWAQYDKKLKRPPIVSFKVANGVGSIYYAKALIMGANLTYKEYDNAGNLVHAEVALNIKEYTSYTQTTQSFDTRYHNVMDGEYHELLAAREYKNPMLGIVLRQYNEQSEIGTGDVVKLPDKQSQSVSPILIKPKSLIFTDYTDSKSYTRFLNNKTEESPPHIRDIINDKLEQRLEQYGTINI
jgi:hypothetical protein